MDEVSESAVCSSRSAYHGGPSHERGAVDAEDGDRAARMTTDCSALLDEKRASRARGDRIRTADMPHSSSSRERKERRLKQHQLHIG